MLRRPVPGDRALFEHATPNGGLELERALAHWRRHRFGHWAVEEGGSFVAVLEVHYAGPGITGVAEDEVELGWTVVEPARGRGIATEAARAAAADAFARTGAPWLVAYIQPDNTASIRVAEKLGMRHDADGLTRLGHPMLIYRLRPERPM